MLPSMEKVLNYIFFAILLLISIGLAVRGDYKFIFSPGIMGLAYVGFLYLEGQTHFHLRFPLRCCMMLVIIAHNLIGEYLYAYEWSAYFDKVLHLFGTFSFTLLIYALLKDFISIRTSHPFLFTFLLVTAIGLSLGTVFELAEFALDILFSENNQRGLTDTNMDIIYDLIGAVIASVYQARRSPLSKL